MPRTRRFQKSTMTAAFDACGGRCFYCGTQLTLVFVKGSPTWHCDHLMPSSLGGVDADGNAVAACVPCNTAKRDLFHEQFVLNEVTKARLATRDAKFSYLRCHGWNEDSTRCAASAFPRRISSNSPPRASRRRRSRCRARGAVITRANEGAAIVGASVRRRVRSANELLFMAQRDDHVADRVDVPGFCGVLDSARTRLAVVVERPSVTCARDLALIAFMFQAVKGSNLTRRPDMDAAKNVEWRESFEFSARVTLEAAARFRVGDVLEAHNVVDVAFVPLRGLDERAAVLGQGVDYRACVLMNRFGPPALSTSRARWRAR